MAQKEVVSWHESYSIGIKEIDDQHKELLKIVNSLFSRVSGSVEEERAYFSQVIHQAAAYVKTHFANEEKYMVATKFSGYVEHKKIHDEFVLKIVNISKDFDAGKRLVLEKLAYFLKDWVLSHIAVMDTQYARYFRSIATRKECGKLSITMADVRKI